MTTPNEITPIEPVLDTPVAQEPVARPDEYAFFSDWYSKEAPDESEVRPFDMARHAWLAGTRFADLFPAAPVAAQAQPTWDDLQALAVKHGAWDPGYGPFAAELLATYGLAPAAQPHWVMNWLNAMNAVGGQAQLMATCPTCGNKRCPHAQDQQNACTGSNEPGQPVSGADGSDTERVLIDGTAYQVPAAVAGELLRLHLELHAAAQPLPSGNAGQLRSALEETQALLAAMMHEPRPITEIEEQMVENRDALGALDSGQDRGDVNRLVAEEYERWVRAHASGQEYDDFLTNELAARAAKEQS